MLPKNSMSPYAETTHQSHHLAWHFRHVVVPVFLFCFMNVPVVFGQGSASNGDLNQNASQLVDPASARLPGLPPLTDIQSPCSTSQGSNGTDNVSAFQNGFKGCDLDIRQSADDSDLVRRRGRRVGEIATREAQPLVGQTSEFQRLVAASTGRLIPIFGANLFASTPSTFAPVDSIPVTPDYVIGPGDELRLQIWGQINQRGTYVVDRTGSISLPDVGTLHVAGVQFSKLDPFLRSQLGRVYRNFDLNINLGQLRSIQVFVVGYANRPGSYSIGSLSTLLNALFVSGGPLPQGSLRDVQVKRGSETITHFDLYDLLLRGDKSKDIHLASGDVIFIPAVGPQVAVVGSVTSPAIYELRNEESFEQALSLAGGLTNTATNSKARVERVSHRTERTVIDLDLKSGGSELVQDGDIIFVKSIQPRFNDTVTLRGNVANPGRFAWREGMRISDLIPNRDSLVTRNYYQQQNQLGEADTDYDGSDVAETVNSSSGLGKKFNEGATLSGQIPSQRARAAANGGGNSAATALVSGGGNFEPKTEVILSAPDIDWEYAVIERQGAENLTTSLLPFNLGKVVLSKDSSENLPLLPGDVLTIFSKADIRVPSMQQTKLVRLEGEFVQAGVYSVRPGETLQKLLARAGGLTTEADLYASEFTRDSVRRLQKERLAEYADALESQMQARTAGSISSALTERDAAAAKSSEVEDQAALARLRQLQPTGRIVLQLKPDSTLISEVPDLELEDGDRFVVPKTPASVTVQGQVYSANAFVYQSGKRVQDYLHLAGGPDRIADINRDFLLRADGSVISHQYTSSRRGGNFSSLRVLPGDTIVVPPKLDKGAFIRNLLNVSTIVQGFGLGAAAIQVLR